MARRRSSWQKPARTTRLLAAGALALAGAAAIVSGRAAAAERAHPPKGRFVMSNGVRLHYLEQGSGPPVVFLHGNGMMADDFLACGLLGTTGRQHRSYAFDRPGFGYSERPWTQSWSARAQARLLPAAFANLGIHRPVVYGHSWGALVALALAIDHPDDVAGLVLASGYYYPTARVDVGLFSPPAIPVVGDVLRFTVAPIIGEALAPRLIDKMFAPQAVPGAFRAAVPVSLMTRPSQIRAAAEDAAHMITSASELSEHYDQLHMPIMILAGDADEVVTTERQAQRLHREIPHSRLRTFPGFGHMLHYFHVDEIARTIDDLDSRHSIH